MKWLLILLPGGFVIGGGLLLFDLYNSLVTDTDKDVLIPPLMWGLLSVLKPVTPAQYQDALAQGRALMAIAISENSIGLVGDQDPSLAPGGPSISPWQIERINSVSHGYWTPPDDGSDPRAAYAALPTIGAGGGVSLDTFAWAAHAVDFFNSDVWPLANGDLKTALEVWNGGPRGPSNSRAQTYAARGAAGVPSEWSA